MTHLFRWSHCLLVFSIFATSSIQTACGPAVAAGVGSASLASMPIREVSIFKDGHAFVSHSGKVATDTDGNVLLDYLPAPVLGTFWPFSDDPQAKLKSVTVGRKRISLEKTAITIRDLLSANVGKRVEVRESNNQDYRATIESVPTITADELEASAPAGADLR